MRVLIVKTSSLGDVIHTLPALTEAHRHHPDIEFHWAVEEHFADIPALHPAVKKVLPVYYRALRKNPRLIFQKNLLLKLIGHLRQTPYDLIIDAQGLCKSALMAWLARGPVSGLDKKSAREPLSTWLYQKAYFVPKGQHAVSRLRQLFAQVFDYEPPEEPPDYGLNKALLPTPDLNRPYCVFFHGTTWDTKHWPEVYWCGLAKLVCDAGYRVYLPWGNESEKARAERIASGVQGASLLPKKSLKELAGVVAHAKGCVAVDTGLGHLAAAFHVPCVSLYGPTNPGLTGAVGGSQSHLQANYPCSPCLKKTCPLEEVTDSTGQSISPPCFSTVSPAQVMGQLNGLLEGAITPPEVAKTRETRDFHWPFHHRTDWTLEDIHQWIRKQGGAYFRNFPWRKTLGFSHNGKAYFAKLHFGVGWKEIFKNLVTLKWPVLGAKPECQAISRCHEIGVPTMTVVEQARRRWNPAKQQSYLVTEALTDTEDMASVGKGWKANPPAFPNKLLHIKTIAEMVKRLHSHGINHRDLYLVHFLKKKQAPCDLYLIDLHRAQIRAKVPRRWLVKDLGSLYYSALDCSLTQRDLFRFLKIYYNKPLRAILLEEQKPLEQIIHRSKKLKGRLPRELRS